MKFNLKSNFFSGLLGGVMFALPAAGLISCNLVKEDLDPCPPEGPVGVELRFIYEYNMEFANAFHRQVDCLSAYFFDGEGKLVAVEKVTDPSLLADEDYRMHPQIEPGTYHVVAYGGMDCDESSFSHITAPEPGVHVSSLHVALDGDCLTTPERMRLHNHFYGAADFTYEAGTYSKATVEMMRNTNSIQVALQHLNGSEIDHNDFIFEIIDDNNEFNHENNLLPTGEITYSPWNRENRSTGTVGRADGEVEEKEYFSAIAQFTTSRLVHRKATSTTLRVRRAEDGETVFRVPIVNYMLMFKDGDTTNGAQNMGDQEYLDRENSWRFVFFLDESNDNLWVSTRIFVNDWEVRLNDTEF